MKLYSYTISGILSVSLFVGCSAGLSVPSVGHAQSFVPYYSFPLSVQGGENQGRVPKCTLGANPVLVYAPNTTTLSWTTENASSVYITDVGSVATSGQQVVSGIYGTRSFSLTATNSYGSHTCNVTVFGQGVSTQGTGGVIQTYNQPTGTTGTPENPGCYIAVTPATVSNAAGATLSWLGAGALSATISGIGSVAVSGTHAIVPTATQTYTLTVFGTNNISRSCSATVQVSGTGNATNNAYNSGYYSNYTTYQYPQNYTYTGGQYGYTAYDGGTAAPTYSTNSGYYAPTTYSAPRSVALRHVPYTGPTEDMAAGLFSIAVLATSLYGMRRLVG